MKIKSLLLSLFLLAFSAITINAQEGFNKDEKLPLNPNVKFGVLENGLTYYVLHNEEPKDRASFYIVQNVGAVLENDDQNGLAHFLEHMAFNGTKNFPDKGILDYLESYGVAFGRNINAYTNIDETVYNLSNVPVNNENLIDSTLLILHDWSNYLTLADEEIDSERGVIHEEWRTRRSGRMRVFLETRKLLFKGSKYENRDVIGDLDVIDNFEYKAIRDFYHDYYRTDLQAIVVVGDIDADKMEGKIKELFSKIPAVKNPKKREYFDVPMNDEIIYGKVTDPEAANVSFSFYTKHKATPFEEKNMGYYRNGVLEELYSNMIGDRISELLQKGTPPFINGYAAYYNMVRKMDVYNVNSTLNENNIIGGVEAIMTENERVLRYGFLASELERAKIALLSAYEKAYKERNKQHSDRLVRGLNRNYLSNEPEPGIAYEFELIQKLLPGITVDEINALAKKWNTEKNIVISLSGPEKEGLTYPSKEEVLAAIKKVKNSKIEPYVDNAIDKPLIESLPEAGKVEKEQKLDDFDAVEWTLSNGAKIAVKTTDFKENEIQLNAFSVGGTSLYGADILSSAEMLPGFAGSFGVGEFDQVNLQKLLTGKVVKLSPYMTDLHEGFKGSSSIDDFETLLQLLHLQFEKPRFDKEAFEALKARYLAYVANLNADVNKAFRDSISVTTTDHHERTILFNSAKIESLDFEAMKKVYQDRFVDASDFTFVFVGNIDIEKAKPMIEKYIGSIKPLNREENWKDNQVNYPEKEALNHFNKEMETNKTSIYINLNEKMDYTAYNRILLATTAKMLDKRYMEVIREQEGGTYGVRVSGSVSHYPNEEFSLVVMFDTDPEKAEKLKGIVYSEIEKLYKEGVKVADLEEAKKNYLKVREENLRKNGYWMSALQTYYQDNENIIAKSAYEDIVNAITKEQVEKFAKKYLSKTNKVEVIMSPVVN